MAIRKRSFSEMVKDGLAYLSDNTEITYFGDGSIARSLVESLALEISRATDFVSVHYENRHLSTAGGVFLDLYGEMLGVPRIQQSRASVDAEDQVIRFFVRSGTLAARIPDPADNSRGLIPAGTTISNADGSVEFLIPNGVVFPRNSKNVYVSAIARQPGKQASVGANQLVNHSLGISDIQVTNDVTITTGTDLEPDEEYRFRLSKAMTTRASANETAVQVVASTARGVSRADLVEFARGAGTFDVLLVPQGNRLPKATIDETLRNIEEVSAFGISPRIREPLYTPFKISVQLRFRMGLEQGRQAVLRNRTQQSILSYFSSIPIGGELIINQLRASVLNTSQDIEDLRIIELCLDRRPRAIRNHKLRRDEVFIPDETAPDPVEVL